MRKLLLIIITLAFFSASTLAQNSRFLLFKITQERDASTLSSKTSFDLYIYSGATLKKVLSNLETDTVIRISGVTGPVYKASVHRIGYPNLDTYWKFDTIRVNYVKTLVLSTAPIQLKGVDIKSHRGSYKKGDTLFIPVDSIRTMPHASASELLDKIPGATVSANGNVSMMGKKVDKIKVDGVEVFGGNPKATLENLRADMLKDVEVINADGEGGKGIELNLKLKKDKKDGIYGEVYDQEGTDSRTNAGFKLNEIKPSMFLNSFFNYNNQNQQVLSPFDYFQIVGFSGDGDNTLGTQKLYYDNKLEDPFNSLNKIADLFPFLQKGVHQTFSGGMNLSKTYKKVSWNSYLLGSYDKAYTDGLSNTIRSLGDLNSHDLESTTDHSSLYDVIGQSNLKWVADEKNTVNGKLIVERKHVQDNPEDLLNSSLYNCSDSLLNSSAINSNQQITNTNDLYFASGSWEHRYHKPAEKTTISGGLLINQTDYHNGYLNQTAIGNIPIESNNSIAQTNANYNYFANIQHSTPLSRKFLVDFRVSTLFSSNSVNRTGEDLSAGQPPVSSPALSANDFHLRNNNTAAQTFLFYKAGSLSVIAGLGALVTNWAVSAGDTTYNRVNKTAFLPGFYLNYGMGRSKVSFRYVREQAAPSMNNLLPATDSSKVQQVTRGNPLLSPYLTDKYEFNSDIFIKKLGAVNFQFNYSVTNQPVADSYIFENGLYPLLSYTQYKKAQTITGSIVYININQSTLFNPYVFLFYLWQSQYQLNQQIATPISFNAVTSTVGVKMNITKEHSLNLSIQSTINSTHFATATNGSANRFNMELKDDNKIGNELYYKFSTKWILIYANGSYTDIRPVTNFSLYQYLGKQHNWQLNCGINNLFNVDEIRLVNVGITQRTLSSYNYLARYVNVGLTFYPEKWKK